MLAVMQLVTVRQGWALPEHVYVSSAACMAIFWWKYVPELPTNTLSVHPSPHVWYISGTFRRHLSVPISDSTCTQQQGM